MQTALVEGSIGLSAEKGGPEYRMKPSQLGEYRRTDASVNVKTVDIEPYVSWKDGFFVFENQTMEQIHEHAGGMTWMFLHERAIKEFTFYGTRTKRYEQIDNILKAIKSAVGVTLQ